MSDLLFQATGFASGRLDLPVVQNVSDVLQTARYEKDAYGHWAFYTDTPLVDKVNSKTLTLQSGAAIQPIYSNEGVALTNAMGSALLSDLADGASTNITAVFVAKTTNNGLYLLGMTLPTSNSTTENGAGVYLSADKAYLNVKPLAANGTGGISGLTTNQNIAQTGYCLVAVSIDKAKKTALLYTMKGSNDAFVSTTFTSDYAASAKKLSVGNAYYTIGEFGTKTTFAEAIFYNKALSLTELKLLASRTKFRLAQNGINI
jgi:hypothetical protein